MSNELPKIAFCWRSSSLTGAQRRFISLARYLNEQGQDAIVLLEKRDALALEEITGSEIPHLVSFEWPWWIRILGRGRSRFCDLWVSLGGRSLFYFASKRYLNNLQGKLGIGLWHVSMSDQFAHSVSGCAVFEVTSPDWADRIVERPETVPRDILLHAVSENVYDRLAKGLPDRQLLCAPDMFPNVDPAAALYPSIKEKEKLIVFAHRFVPRKNGLLFANVAKRFLDCHPEWRVLFRGEGPDEAAIRNVLCKYISSARVEVGYTSNLGDELRKSRIFVSIIEHDNYPSQSVLEAMVRGNALLLSDRGYTKDKFVDGNGIMTSLDEDDVLANLSRMASNVDRLDEMGLRSFDLARERFSREKYLEHIEVVYRKAGFCRGE